jgi:hypothetical protein
MYLYEVAILISILFDCCTIAEPIIRTCLNFVLPFSPFCVFLFQAMRVVYRSFGASQKRLFATTTTQHTQAHAGASEFAVPDSIIARDILFKNKMSYLREKLVSDTRFRMPMSEFEQVFFFFFFFFFSLTILLSSCLMKTKFLVLTVSSF